MTALDEEILKLEVNWWRNMKKWCRVDLDWNFRKKFEDWNVRKEHNDDCIQGKRMDSKQPK